jgi:hypothetical protein
VNAAQPPAAPPGEAGPAIGARMIGRRKTFVAEDHCQ